MVLEVSFSGIFLLGVSKFADRVSRSLGFVVFSNFESNVVEFMGTGYRSELAD